MQGREGERRRQEGRKDERKAIIFLCLNMVNSGHRVQQINICVCVLMQRLWIDAVLDEDEMRMAFYTDEGGVSQSAVGGKSNLS